MSAAREDAERVRDDGGVPSYLRDHSLDGPAGRRAASQYKYPHDYPAGYVKQQYLPDALKNKVYYVPGERGYERTVAEIRKSKGKSYQGGKFPPATLCMPAARSLSLRAAGVFYS